MERRETRPVTIDDALLAAADRNYLNAWAALLAASPEPLRVAGDGVVMLSSGTPASLFNPAFVLPEAGDPGDIVVNVVEHYDALGLPFVLHFRDAYAPSLAAECAAAGLVEHWQPPLMVLDPIPDWRPPDTLELSELTVDNVEEYVDVIAGGFGMPRELVGLLLGEATLEAAGLVGLLGRVDGRPVASSAVFVSDGVAGVYNVATLPDQRRRGLGASMTWAAALAGRERGMTASILQASKEGEPVYTRMGYVTPDRYRQFEVASDASA